MATLSDGEPRCLMAGNGLHWLHMIQNIYDVKIRAFTRSHMHGSWGGGIDPHHRLTLDSLLSQSSTGTLFLLIWSTPKLQSWTFIPCTILDYSWPPRCKRCNHAFKGPEFLVRRWGRGRHSSQTDPWLSSFTVFSWNILSTDVNYTTNSNLGSIMYFSGIPPPSFTVINCNSSCRYEVDKSAKLNFHSMYHPGLQLTPTRCKRCI